MAKFGIENSPDMLPGRGITVPRGRPQYLPGGMAPPSNFLAGNRPVPLELRLREHKRHRDAGTTSISPENCEVPERRPSHRRGYRCCAGCSPWTRKLTLAECVATLKLRLSRLAPGWRTRRRCYSGSLLKGPGGASPAAPEFANIGLYTKYNSKKQQWNQWRLRIVYNKTISEVHFGGFSRPRVLIISPGYLIGETDYGQYDRR